MATGKQWSEMSADERNAEVARKRARASELIKAGGFPKALKAETLAAALVGHTLMPTGGTDKGSVSYSLPALTITVEGGKRIRINKFSASVLADGQAEGVDVGDSDYVL